MEQHIFKPASMNTMGFVLDESLSHNCVSTGLSRHGLTVQGFNALHSALQSMFCNAHAMRFYIQTQKNIIWQKLFRLKARLPSVGFTSCGCYHPEQMATMEASSSRGFQCSFRSASSSPIYSQVGLRACKSRPLCIYCCLVIFLSIYPMVWSPYLVPRTTSRIIATSNTTNCK